MIELFRNGTEALGWIFLGGAWAMQIGLLLIAVRGAEKLAMAADVCLSDPFLHQCFCSFPLL